MTRPNARSVQSEARATPARSDPPRTARPRSVPRAGSLRRPAILYVEDHDDARLLLRDLLAVEGFVVTTAASVSEALAAMDAGTRFDVIVTDHSLPDGTGIEMLETARATGRLNETTRVFLFTAEPHLLALGDIAVVRKSLGPEALLRALHERCDA